MQLKKIPTTSSLRNQSANLLQDIHEELRTLSMPRSLQLNQARHNKQAKTRDAIYMEREEIFKDKSVREMVKLIIKRSQITPFYIRIQRGVIDDKIVDEIQGNFEYLQKIIEKDLLEVTIESQFLGDSYIAIRVEEDKGIVQLTHNFSTKAFNVTPIVSNWGREVAYEIDRNITGGYTTKQYKRPKNNAERTYLNPIYISRMNALSSGIRTPTVTSLLDAEKMNAWAEEQPYEDLIYGGVVEDCLESYRKFRWALNALSNVRTGSSYIERFIMMHMQDTSTKERQQLREALRTNLATVRKRIDAKQSSLDPSVSVFDYIIPTTGANAKGSIDIQESSPSLEALQSIEDINIHIKKFMADLGFNINLTPYGDSQEGGGEDGGFTQKSLIMESTGEQIRQAVSDYILKIVKVHILGKYGIEFEEDIISVEYAGVVEMARVADEINRMEALNNAQNFWGFISDLREQRFKDTPKIREMLIDQIRPKMERHTQDKDDSLMVIVDHVLTPEPIEEEGN